MKPDTTTLVRMVVKCEHKNTVVGYGADTSTTGPTGIWETCSTCGKTELVGHRGRNSDVLYNSDEYRAKQALYQKLHEELVDGWGETLCRQ